MGVRRVKSNDGHDERGAPMVQARPLPPDDEQDPLETTPPDPGDDEVPDDEQEKPTIEPDDAKPTEDPGTSPI